MTRTLDQWLAYQETTNVHEIELGLDRVRAVWQAMGAPRPAPVVITVGGTNGKGSTVALLEGMLRAAGYRTGCYTSPHLVHYNERVRIEGVDAGDAQLIASFERIEAARGTLPQTYFEFGTLAAIDVMSRAHIDVAILEVGLGGRLDAVNIIDADAVVITTIDLDHQAWLGNDRDSIGREKAGIARAGRPAVVGELDPPEGLLDALRGAGAVIERAGSSFWWDVSVGERGAGHWQWFHTDGTTLDLPRPALAAPVQYANASAAIACLHALRERLAVPAAAVASALANVHVEGRLQRVGERPLTLVDVGHNPQAARALADWLDAQPDMGRVMAVYGALADKDVAGVIAALGDRIDHWFLAGLDRDTPRGLPAAALEEAFLVALPGAAREGYPDVDSAWRAARQASTADDTVLLFGSFFVASAVLTTRP
ncbi:bifunctional tetrahydrofolate synthase/dihydrofolate synthase [Luteibacter aegosomatissinici]|uniref:bifunctional tetrahydrofolate synthase/dihydrofolate synthase n=1 Tax=Luteibacter aegosomatissinici TaxID=2911539 RepID=UPI001FFAF60D|nr:bifunctional tetrahydrofolate synthase/dihydrofolate synthase [Luteibacter aegosomatissinici]UPG93189.1 bifunctional tetrahydrofolate synthase/dihydrofolate synthase [Luteibacter aegosomatissinici]